MKKRILSLILTVAMMLSVMTILPISVSAEENTWNYESGVYKISTYEDFQAFKAKVDGGTDFSGKTVTLEADITLPDGHSAIGPNSGGTSRYFRGTFDGQGHTITFADENDNGQGQYGVFRRLDGATIKDLNLDGTIVISTEDSYAAPLAMEANGNCLIQNVHSSVYLSATKNAYYVGGLVSYIKNASGHSLTFDGCVFDGKMNFPNFTKYSGGLLGYFEHTGAYLTIKNSVFAGTIMLNDSNYSYRVGGFVGWGANVTINDCISIGKITFNPAKSWTDSADDDYRGTLIGEVKTNATLTNVYYFDVAAPEGYTTDYLPAICKATNTPTTTNVVAKTAAEMAALTAINFSAETKLSFKTSTDIDTYYPCPTGLVKNGEWVDCLKVSVDAKVLGAQIRITEENDPYSGIRFVAKFRESITDGAGTDDANFGLILISASNYDKQSTIADLLAAGGVQVAATKSTTEDGIVTVKAVIYEIAEAYYAEGIVAIPYADGVVIGSAVERSIYSVAQACVEANTDSDLAIEFAEDIIATVEANAEA